MKEVRLEHICISSPKFFKNNQVKKAAKWGLEINRYNIPRYEACLKCEGVEMVCDNYFTIIDYIKL